MTVWEYVNNYDYSGIQADKVQHIKLSARIALYLHKFIPFQTICYILTLFIGIVKEIFDFLDPNGHCELADIYADHVGASAVFGVYSFDRQYKKYKPFFCFWGF